MNRNSIRFTLLTLLGLVTMTSCAKLQKTPEFSQKSWPKQCQAMKKEVFQPSDLFGLTYQPRPENVTVQNSWQLAWFGRRVPVPAIAYSEVFVSKSEDQSYFVFLKGQVKGENVDVILGQFQLDSPIEDVFSTVSGLIEVEESVTVEGKALTQKLFGGPVEIGQLFNLGYQYTPADLSCDSVAWEKEVPIAIALVMKGVVAPGGNPMAVYAFNQGQITQSSIQNAENTQESWVAQWHEGSTMTDVMFRLPQNHGYGELGLGIGQTDWDAATDPPQWLNLLETAIAQPQADQWQALASELERVGMSKKSVQSVKAIAKDAAN